MFSVAAAWFQLVVRFIAVGSFKSAATSLVFLSALGAAASHPEPTVVSWFLSLGACTVARTYAGDEYGRELGDAHLGTSFPAALNESLCAWFLSSPAGVLACFPALQGVVILRRRGLSAWLKFE